MDEFWDSTGLCSLAKLADRVVPIPRDDEAPVSLYALCRAWVRNNPALPVVAEAQSEQQPDQRDAGTRNGGAGKAVGEVLQPQASPQLQPLVDPQPPQPPTHDAQSSGLLSILPPVLPPTALETDTAPPAYPLDDFEAHEPEDALRKFKQHWVAVRQYHQALRAAKLSRHRERLMALLGEPSVLQPPLPLVGMQMQVHVQPPGLGLAFGPGLTSNPQALQQQQQLQQQGGVLGLTGQMLTEQIPNGGLQGLGAFSGAGLGPAAGAGAGAGLGLLGGGATGFGLAGTSGGLPPAGAAVSSVAEAQAALATLMNLPPGPADGPEGQQLQPQLLHSPLPLQPPQQQQAGPATAGALTGSAAEVVLPAMGALLAMQQQQQPSHEPLPLSLPPQPDPRVSAAATGTAAVHSVPPPLVAVSEQQPLLSQLASALAAGAEAGGAQGPSQLRTPAGVHADAGGGAALRAAAESQQAALAAAVSAAAAAVAADGTAQQLAAPQAPVPEVLDSMEVDLRPPAGP